MEITPKPYKWGRPFVVLRKINNNVGFPTRKTTNIQTIVSLHGRYNIIKKCIVMTDQSVATFVQRLLVSEELN